ncbi:MAG: RsmB/NOP family class I SAM-dependent RNA methyltransferase [Firmicutes bacterium]|nr:RsmB/NOP family class I SAM-dependent RNA methyltransferase [Bacillota bacterium]
MLPELFLDRMRTMLGDEYPAFLASYDSPKYQSLRVNLLKGSGEALKAKMDCLIKNVPWATEGYYYKEDSRPGKYPLHEAGAYYIQEASAMAPAAYLGVQPGEKVLDLCAAPGGKSTQIAAAMQGQGLLICNEIHSQRARILSENIERMGIRNAIVINHEPSCLAERFRGYFDKIVVDAPCSGEGMFRKNEEAVLQWSPANVEMCGKRQDEILDYAAMMLRPGGRMIYSTCTFAPTENEGTVSRFLSKHSEFRTEPLKKYSGMEAGKPEFAEDQTDGIENTIRLWPHKLEGEGHFLAAFQKEGTWEGDTVSPLGVEKGICLKECREWQEFREQYLRTAFSGIYLKFGEQLYLAPDGTPALKGLKVLRPGLHLGTIKKNRFEPAHALALALKPEEVKNVHTLSVSEAAGYLSGQTFPAEGEKGWYLITVEGYSLGWGKLAGGVMKNHYPKGLRK